MCVSWIWCLISTRYVVDVFAGFWDMGKMYRVGEEGVRNDEHIGLIHYGLG